MATTFLSRVERIDRNLFPNPSATTDVDPLSYNPNVQSIKKSLPSFAAFTSSKRLSVPTPATLSSPSPSTYYPIKPLLRNSNSNSAIFKSGKSRFEEIHSETPPAGAYNIKSYFDIKKPKKPLVANTAIFDIVKQSNTQPKVPSIPTKDQSYGYDEDDSGRLKQQPSARYGFSGDFVVLSLFLLLVRLSP